MNKISILDIVHDTTVDGPGFRIALYAAGCEHRCKGCHNPQSWDISRGTEYTIDELLKIVKDAEFANVTFTGGDPLMQSDEFTELARCIKAETNKNIWCYTGFSYECIIGLNSLSQILPFIDVLIDGRYIEELRDETLAFRGSSNQRIIDVQQSLASHKLILWSNDFHAESVVNNLSSGND